MSVSACHALPGCPSKTLAFRSCQRPSVGSRNQKFEEESIRIGAVVCAWPHVVDHRQGTFLLWDDHARSRLHRVPFDTRARTLQSK